MIQEIDRKVREIAFEAVSKDERVMVLLGETYYRSDLAAELIDMHRYTLLRKAKEGKISRFRHKRAVWFKEIWLKEYVAKGSV